MCEAVVGAWRGLSVWSVLVLGLASSCATPLVGWRQPELQERSILLMPTLIDGGVPQELNEAAQYQVAACENIAVAYHATARKKNTVSIVSQVLGGIAAVAGGTMTVVGATDLPTPQAKTNLTVAGSVLSAVGASAVAVISGVAGSDSSADAYGDTATVIRAAVNDFRKELRELALSDAATSDDKRRALIPAVITTQICALRSVCMDAVPPAGSVGRPFKCKEAPGSQSVSERINAMCSPDSARVAPKCED